MTTFEPGGSCLAPEVCNFILVHHESDYKHGFCLVQRRILFNRDSLPKITVNIEKSLKHPTDRAASKPVIWWTCIIVAFVAVAAVAIGVGVGTWHTRRSYSSTIMYEFLFDPRGCSLTAPVLYLPVRRFQIHQRRLDLPIPSHHQLRLQPTSPETVASIFKNAKTVQPTARTYSPL